MSSSARSESSWLWVAGEGTCDGAEFEMAVVSEVGLSAGGCWSVEGKVVLRVGARLTDDD